MKERKDHRAVLRALAFGKADARRFAAGAIPGIAGIGRFSVGALNPAAGADFLIEHRVHDLALVAAIRQTHAATLPVRVPPCGLAGKGQARDAGQKAAVALRQEPPLFQNLRQTLQLLAPGVRGDYFAYRPMQTSDVFKAARDAGLHRTNASSMFFASVSAFYGPRAEIRKVLLRRLLPGLPALMRLLTSNRAAPLADEQIYRGAIANLRAYSKLAASQNSRIILVLPPQIEPEGVAMTKLAALQAGITVVSVSPDVTGPSDFRDGFHLNAAGARKYTAALIPAIAKALP